jgi:hypothetical protein
VAYGGSEACDPFSHGIRPKLAPIITRITEVNVRAFEHGHESEFVLDHLEPDLYIENIGNLDNLRFTTECGVAHATLFGGGEAAPVHSP